MSSSNETLPSSAFESLLPKLLTILQVTQRPEGTTNVRNKQDLLQAIQAFRESMSHARDVAGALPGGELLIEEQDEIIAMLERLRAKKRLQLQDFSDKVIDTKGHDVPQYGVGQNPQMEVDSNASTPA
ncbi:hypothetical protein EDB92DRAFT_1050247 [Lactarius akahatsu]|uniref:Mediator of RNA polymerase II transcription subunit 9 n=1 Tax=Lactarius akahatsu TaxID=416441 RepID=A0AAD4LE07_9AGAM|nr:hypothetical protein EDB92DRAFT_1050247 [Lactarius akahatsu]